MQGFSIHGIAGDDDAAQQVHNAALRHLLGFTPFGCGEIRPAFFAGVGKISTLGQPSRYSAVQAFKFLMNSTTPAL
jgi:predicted dinucleotide-binding enzyme